MRPESPRRAAERPARRAVAARTRARAYWECQAAEIVPEIDCWGLLDVDERCSRGVNPGGHLDDSNTQALCRAHHRWRTEHPTEAWRRGLRVLSWETDTGGPGGVVCRGWLGRRCPSIKLGRHTVWSAAQLLELVDIPDTVLEAACALDDDLVPVDTCFCVVDAGGILTGLGFRWVQDPFTGGWLVIT